MPSTSPEVTAFFDLAQRCNVSIYAACKRAGVSRGTPEKWKRCGTTPLTSTLRKLREAVIETAKERGTLPDDIAEREAAS